jgi:2-polyprenyl-6-methoxyphenol hydroxylase-like FAD-dependent oxidoreductase
VAAAPARSAVVVGAGAGGLAVAGGLARTGWRVTLLERADRLRAEPTALLLWPGGVRALYALGLGAGLAAIATEVPGTGLRRPDGRWLVQPGTETGESPLLAHAEDLHDALVAGLGERVEVRTSTAVRPVRSDPDAATGGRARGGAGSWHDLPGVTDGRHTWRAELMVAADGLDSTMRPAVAPGVATVSAGATAWRAVIPWYRAPKLAADLAAPVLAQQDGYRFRTAPLGERSSTGTSGRGGVYWSATVPGAPRPEPASTQLELLRRWFAGWQAPIGELLAATEPEEVVQRELRALRPQPGRLTAPVAAGAWVLLGDAGHAFADHLGQGACLALEDAATLVAAVRDALPGAQLHAAVAAYDRARRARLAEVRRRTRRLGAGGLVAGLGAVQARRRRLAVEAAAQWHPAGPAGHLSQ